jgi:DNA-binding MarR family transcriptional regulator
MLASDQYLALMAELEEDTVPHYDDQLSYWLQFVASHVTSRLGEELEQHDTTVTEWLILRALRGNSDFPHHALQRDLGLTRAATWKAVKRLEERGLIRRALLPDRARLQGLSLTEDGEALVPKLAAAADDNEFVVFMGVTPAMRAALMETLRAVATRHDFGFRHRPRRRRCRPANGL